MMAQLVVLHHTGIDAPHFDFMVERGPAEELRTFRIAHWPIEGAGEQPATELLNHRRDYLTYEGPVSGNRGEVRRVAAGTATITVEEPDRWSLQIHLETPASEHFAIEFRRVQGPDWNVNKLEE